MNKAIVLFSGGIDSSVVVLLAKKEFDVYTLRFDYGQKGKACLSRPGYSRGRQNHAGQ